MLAGGLGAWRLKPDPPFLRGVVRVAHDEGFSEWPTWSNDGRTFAFASNRNGNFDIYLGSTDSSQEVVPLTKNEADNVQPAFSPDGNQIAFASTRSSRTQLVKVGTYTGFDFRTYGGDIWEIPKSGGSPRKLAANGNSPAWHPNSRSIAYVSGKENQRTILEVDSYTSLVKPILASDQSIWEIVSLAYRPPDGRWITFVTSDQRVWALPASGGTPAELLRGRTPAWAPSGQQLLFTVEEPGSTGGTRIERADIEEGSKGLSVARVRTAGVNTATLRELAIDPLDGRRLLMADDEESFNLTRVPLTPAGDNVAGPEERLSTGRSRDRYPSVSPDGRHILVGSNRVGTQELWSVDPLSRDWQRVALPPEALTGGAVTGCWLKDGTLVATTVTSRTTGMVAFWRTALDGSLLTQELVPPSPANESTRMGSFPCSASPKEQGAIVIGNLVGRFTQLVRVDVTSGHEGQRTQLTTSESEKYEASWSPTDPWIAFAANTGDAVNVWRVGTSGEGKEERLTNGFDRIRHVFYSPDGKWLYLQPNHRNIYRIRADGSGQRQPVTHFPDDSSLFLEEPAISPDGRYLVYARNYGSSSIWLLTLTGR